MQDVELNMSSTSPQLANEPSEAVEQRMKRSRRFGLCVAAVVTALAIWAGAWIPIKVAIASSDEIYSATIVEKDTSRSGRRGRRSTSYRVSYEYQLDGKTCRDSRNVDIALYSKVQVPATSIDGQP